jgi:hypothetical protein
MRHPLPCDKRAEDRYWLPLEPLAQALGGQGLPLGDSRAVSFKATGTPITRRACPGTGVFGEGDDQRIKRLDYESALASA